MALTVGALPTPSGFWRLVDRANNYYILGWP
uniref:Uncharacterized protein n=1 Tax=Anopheles atroparvus TaxID=41427 RepID=A0AAG5D6K2_ANOAO